MRMYLLSAPSLTPAGQGLSWFTDEQQGAWEVIDDYLLSKWTDEWMDWWMDGWIDGPMDGWMDGQKCQACGKYIKMLGNSHGHLKKRNSRIKCDSRMKEKVKVSQGKGQMSYTEDRRDLLKLPITRQHGDSERRAGDPRPECRKHLPRSVTPWEAAAPHLPPPGLSPWTWPRGLPGADCKGRR